MSEHAPDYGNSGPFQPSRHVLTRALLPGDPEIFTQMEEMAVEEAAEDRRRVALRHAAQVGAVWDGADSETPSVIAEGIIEMAQAFVSYLERGE